jgi:hypothetical protein
MKKLHVNGKGINLSSMQYGAYINLDGDEFEGLPGIVADRAPWAIIAINTESGYMAFGSVFDYNVWKRAEEIKNKAVKVIQLVADHGLLDKLFKISRN